MAGRKRKLNTSKNESNEEKLQREMIKNKLEEYESIQLTPSRHLSPKAKAEYRRIRPLLEELPIAALDKTMIESYCTLYAIYLELEADINEQGEMVTTYYADGQVKERKPNPTIHEMLKVIKELKSISSELGMTISSRMRLVSPIIDEKNDPFASMFNEGE